MLAQQGQCHRILIPVATARFGTDCKIVHVTQCHQLSTAAPTGGAGDGIPADVLARTIDDRKVRNVAVCFQYS
jgi:hypothetical protein